MSKFDLMAGNIVTTGKYDIWCDRRDFEFHSDHYEGYLNATKVSIEASGYPYRQPVLSIYDRVIKPEAGDDLRIDGLGTLVFIVDKITHYGSRVNDGMKISVLSGMEHG